MIHRWHIVISGFTQSIERANGMDRLWLKLRLHASSLVTLIPPQKWNADFAALAEFIERMKPVEDPVDVRVYAYSWGCGYGFLKLAKELKKRGHKINYAVLCDPVFHSWKRSWRSMWLSPPIWIPDNVNEVFWFKQTQNKPQATNLKPDSPEEYITTIHNPVELKADHAWMDDQKEFHDRCLHVAAL